MNALDEFLREHPTARVEFYLCPDTRSVEARIDLGEQHSLARASDSKGAAERAVARMREHLRSVAQRNAPDENARAAAHFKVVRMTRSMFDQLPEYSCSLPTGTTIGKTWKRRMPYRPLVKGTPTIWYLGTYVPGAVSGEVGIEWREIEIVDQPAAHL